MNYKRWIFSLLALIILLAGCRSGGISVSGAWARPAALSANSAIYLEMQNSGSRNDTLLSASTSVASSAGLHLSQDQAGVMSMHHQEMIPIPAGETVSLAPGGLHIMLTGLNQDLKVGNSFTVTLQLQNAGKIDIEVTVKNQ